MPFELKADFQSGKLNHIEKPHKQKKGCENKNPFCDVHVL